MQKLPPKRHNLPAELFDMKALSPGGEEEEEEEEEDEEKEEAAAVVVEKNEDNDDKEYATVTKMASSAGMSQESTSSGGQGREAAQPKGKKTELQEELEEGEGGWKFLTPLGGSSSNLYETILLPECQPYKELCEEKICTITLIPMCIEVIRFFTVS